KLHCFSSLLGEHGDARAERIEVARRATAAGADRVDVLDEMAEDVSAGLARDRIGPGTGIALDTAGVLAEARHVERGEVEDRDDRVSTPADGSRKRDEST